jgi:hypothetical protein
MRSLPPSRQRSSPSPKLPNNAPAQDHSGASARLCAAPSYTPAAANTRRYSRAVLRPLRSSFAARRSVSPNRAIAPAPAVDAYRSSVRSSVDPGLLRPDLPRLPPPPSISGSRPRSQVDPLGRSPPHFPRFRSQSSGSAWPISVGSAWPIRTGPAWPIARDLIARSAT